MTRHAFLAHCESVDSDYEEGPRKEEWAALVKDQKADPAPACPRTGKEQVTFFFFKSQESHMSTFHSNQAHIILYFQPFIPPFHMTRSTQGIWKEG